MSNRLLRIPNDRWQDAIEIGNGVVEGTVEAATQDGTTSLTNIWHPGPRNDVWYRYTASVASVLQISGCSGEPEEERHINLISVHAAGPGTEFNELGAARFYFFPRYNWCFTDWGDIQVPLAAGQSVLIRVAVERLVPFAFDPEITEPSLRFRLQVPEPDSVLGGWVTLCVIAGLARRRG